MLDPVPDWCEWTHGTSPRLVVAPHGGRRPPVDTARLPSRLRVNDLFTADMTRTLACRLAAGTLINCEQDRNTLDLNRISDVRQRAPWFLDLLVRQADAIIARHGRVEVIFVHGWNIGQPKCDIGIGASETDAGLQLAPGAWLTVDDHYLQHRIAALRAACAEAGIGATIGEKYAGGHRNNMLQLFAAPETAVCDALTRRIAAWSRQGRVNALQLELGIPLRWAGPWREKFVAACVAAFTAPTMLGDLPGEPERQRSRLNTLVPVTTAHHSALQFYDPAADVGMFAGVGPAGPRSTSGRVLLFLGGQQVALFTGEDTHPHGISTPLEMVADRSGLRLRFSGPMLLLDDGAAYVDLEAALGASQLGEADVELDFVSDPHPPSMPRFGVVTGRIRIGSRTLSVHAGGFSNAGGLRASQPSRRQTTVAAAFGARHGVLSHADHTGAAWLACRFREGGIEAIGGARITVSADGDAYTPAALELVSDEHPPLQGWPRSRMAILRPAGRGSYVRVTFGVSEYRWGALAGHGLYEHARAVEREG